MGQAKDAKRPCSMGRIRVRNGIRRIPNVIGVALREKRNAAIDEGVPERQFAAPERFTEKPGNRVAEMSRVIIETNARSPVTTSGNVPTISTFASNAAKRPGVNHAAAPSGAGMESPAALEIMAIHSHQTRTFNQAKPAVFAACPDAETGHRTRPKAPRLPLTCANA